MESNLDMSIEEHIAWTDNINSRLDCIYKDLCKYEEMYNEHDDEPKKLFELLETVSEMHAAAQTLLPAGNLITAKQDDLREQMELLQRSVDLLKLEVKTK